MRRGREGGRSDVEIRKAEIKKGEVQVACRIGQPARHAHTCMDGLKESLSMPCMSKSASRHCSFSRTACY